MRDKAEDKDQAVMRDVVDPISVDGAAADDVVGECQGRNSIASKEEGQDNDGDSFEREYYIDERILHFGWEFIFKFKIHDRETGVDCWSKRWKRF